MIKILVTENDIKIGRRHSCHNCPVAQAIHRYVKCDDLRVHLNTIYFVQNDRTFRIPIEDKQYEKFIIDFDANLPVEPFEFELNI